MLFASMFGMADAFDPGRLRVALQWSPFALFLACFVAMLAVVTYMLRLFFAGDRASAL